MRGSREISLASSLRRASTSQPKETSGFLTFWISFHMCDKIKHCLIENDGSSDGIGIANIFTIVSSSSESELLTADFNINTYFDGNAPEYYIDLTIV